MGAAATSGDERFERALGAVERALVQCRPMRCALPRDGRMLVERALSHLLFHERPPNVADSAADRLVTPLPPYLIAGRGQDETELARGLLHLVTMLATRSGRVCIIELSEQPLVRAPGKAVPEFHIVTRAGAGYDDVIAELRVGLEGIEVLGQKSVVCVERTADEELSRAAHEILADRELADRCLWVRLEVLPIYRDPSLLRCYPLVLAELQHGLYYALLNALHRFAVGYSTEAPRHAAQLGRTTLERAAREVNDTLVDVAGRLGFLINLTPCNMESAWRAFRDAGFEHEPRFEYRPLMLDPLELKRLLFGAPFDAVEDPIVAGLLRQLVQEYDGLLAMLDVRGTQDFLRRSLRAFSAPDDELLGLAEAILERYGSIPASARGTIDAAELARRTQARLAIYQEQDPEFPAVIELRSDVAAGIMVDRGRVLIHEKLRVATPRVEALMAHEVDTHVITFHNGTHQPLGVLGSGLAGYESTQEGLAVLAEYLVGGLTPQRMRVLAARVIAVRALVDNAGFMDVFRLLHHRYEFAPRDAFDIAVRVFRGGGLTKDALYLPGLGQLIRHLRHDGELLPLYAGKVALSQWRELEALRLRSLVRPPRVVPTWLARRDVQQRLKRLRGGLSIFDMASRADSAPDSKKESS